VSISPRAFKENGGRVSRVVVSRAQATNVELAVTLTASVSGQLDLPSQVVIPAGQTSVSFLIGGIQDNVAEGTQTITITFSTSDGSASETVFVLDTTLRATLNVVPRAVREDGRGRTATGVITLNQINEQVLTVRLASSDPGRVRVPETVTIPVGVRFVTFPIGVVDNNVVESDRRVTIVLNSGLPGSGLSTVQITILDDDKEKQPKFVLAIQPLFEGSGRRSVVGVIKVNRAFEEDVRFQLTSSLDKVQVPAQVTLSAGQKLVTFPVTVVNNNVQDDNLDVTIVATSTVITLRETVKVRDDDSGDGNENQNDARFVLAIQPLFEGGDRRVASGVIKVNLNLDQDLTFQLSSSSAKVQVPTEVTLRAGQKLVTFPVRVVDDSAKDGNLDVTITATSSLITLRETIRVRDDESGDDDDDDDDDRSTIGVSTASALASNNSIRLTFTGALSVTSASNAANFQVRAGDVVLNVENVSYSTTDNSIVLVLGANSQLRVGEELQVSFRDLRDASGKILENETVTLTVR
jgi:hypothetical protein